VDHEQMERIARVITQTILRVGENCGSFINGSPVAVSAT